jgi:ubiquinone/menaquinone biosynthesis C-methylase UbiE
MKSLKRRFRRTMRYIRTHWPIFFGLYSVLIVAMFFIGLSLALGWLSFVPFSLVIMLVISYFLVALVYVAYRTNDAPGGTAEENLVRLGQIRPEDRVVCIDLGLRTMAIAIAQRLTTGQVTVIDVHNPQSNTGAALRRARRRAPRPPADPRLTWIDGSISLLPLPDRSVGAVYMNHILSEFWLVEERQRLLAEALRILTPEGKLLIAEPIRGETDLLLTGLVTYSRPADEYWRSLLQSAGFIIRREEKPRGLLACIRADKPSLSAGKQMQLNLEFI